MHIVTLNKTFLWLLIIVSVHHSRAQVRSNNKLDFNQLSIDFLCDIKEGKDTQEIQDQLAHTTIEALEDGLQTDQQKLTFWVNIYNAYIQLILTKNPDLYNDRSSFFEDNRILIAGNLISFAKIEHGIIRKSQWSLGLGYFRTWFPDKFERSLRVDKRDYRVHFALNCGAKDCPPVAIYKADLLNEQFDKVTKLYLKSTSTYDTAKKEVTVTSLFSWFRGDFGGTKGVLAILKGQQLIPTTKRIDITYKNYDWTLELNNFIEL